MEASSGGAEHGSFEQLFVEHAPFAWRVLRRFGVAESDLPDACQDVFIVVHRKLGEFEGRSSLRTWLYRICARVASDYRKRAHRRYETEALTQEPAVGGEQLRTAELTQLCALLEHALDDLDDDKRQVFVLYELEELSMAQIAELLSCPIKTAFSRLYVARDRVNAALRRAGLVVLMVPLDPLPLRELAQAPLASALDAMGVARPTAAQLSAQLTALASIPTAASVSTGYVLLSSGALAVAAAFALTFTGASAPIVKVPRVVTHGATSRTDKLRVHVPPLAIHAPAADLARTSDTITPPPGEPPSLAPTPRRAAVRAPRHAAPRVANASAVEQPHAEALSSSASWIEAPSATQAIPVPAVAVPSTGLDEVLSATSIRPLMRVGPRSIHDAADEPWALLPDSPRKTKL